MGPPDPRGLFWLQSRARPQGPPLSFSFLFFSLFFLGRQFFDRLLSLSSYYFFSSRIAWILSSSYFFSRYVLFVLLYVLFTYRLTFAIAYLSYVLIILSLTYRTLYYASFERVLIFFIILIVTHLYRDRSPTIAIATLL